MELTLNRQAQKTVSTLMTLILIFAPMEAMYASQTHQCDESEVADSMSEKHVHMSKKTAHHEESSSAQSASTKQCASCMDKQCCCDSSSCSCVMLHSMFVPAASVFDFSNNMLPSSISFVHQHHVPPTPVSILRPPIC